MTKHDLTASAAFYLKNLCSLKRLHSVSLSLAIAAGLGLSIATLGYAQTTQVQTEKSLDKTPAGSNTSTKGLISPPLIAARAYVVLDVTSNQFLAQNKAEDRADPASLTKLMTAYVVFDALKEKRLSLEQRVNVSEKAWRAPGSRMFLELNQPVLVKDLLRGMIIQSGNDASIALAEAVGGTEEAFVELMNKQAARLGMKNSHFTNSSGLPDPLHYSNATDLAILAARLIQEFPANYSLYKEHEFTWNRITQPNRNRLLWIDPTVDGVKTGHTETAGYCLVASSLRQGRRILSVVLGTASDSMRAQESLKLLNWAFQNWDTQQLYKKGQLVATPNIWKGKVAQARLGFKDDVFLTLPKGQTEKIQPVLERTDPLIAPIQAGEQLGTLKLQLDGKVIREVPVIALESVEAAGIFGRTWDAIRLMAK